MAEIVYILCAVMSVLSALALFRGYRKNGNRLLLWSALCFGFLAFNNIFLCFDMLVFPEEDLNGPIIRNLISAIAGALLLSGLIVEAS